MFRLSSGIPSKNVRSNPLSAPIEAKGSGKMPASSWPEATASSRAGISLT